MSGKSKQSRKPGQTNLQRVMIVVLCFCALAGIFGSVHRQLEAGAAGGVEMVISILLSIVFAVGVGILRQACFVTFNIAFVFALFMHLVAIWVYNPME